MASKYFVGIQLDLSGSSGGGGGGGRDGGVAVAIANTLNSHILLTIEQAISQLQLHCQVCMRTISGLSGGH